MEKFFLFDKQTRKEAQIDTTRRLDALKECYEMDGFLEIKTGKWYIFSTLDQKII